MNAPAKYKKAIRSNADLELFLKNMGKFDSFFCENMVNGTDFTLVLEVQGTCKGRIKHCRVKSDAFDYAEPNTGDSAKKRG